MLSTTAGFVCWEPINDPLSLLENEVLKAGDWHCGDGQNSICRRVNIHHVDPAGVARVSSTFLFRQLERREEGFRVFRGQIVSRGDQHDSILAVANDKDADSDGQAFSWHVEGRLLAGDVT